MDLAAFRALPAAKSPPAMAGEWHFRQMVAQFEERREIARLCSHLHVQMTLARPNFHAMHRFSDYIDAQGYAMFDIATAEPVTGWPCGEFVCAPREATRADLLLSMRPIACPCPFCTIGMRLEQERAASKEIKRHLVANASEMLDEFVHEAGSIRPPGCFVS